MSPIGSNHSDTVNALTRRLVLNVGDLGVVAVQPWCSSTTSPSLSQTLPCSSHARPIIVMRRHRRTRCC